MPDSALPNAPVTHPDWRFLLAHPAHFIALGAGSGLSRLAPGTVGTLWAWAGYLLLDPLLDDRGWGWLILLTSLVGWWACTRTARQMQVADSSHMVIDEIAAFWLVLWLIMPADFWTQLAAFALFRLFDAVKVGPMAWADRRFKGFGARGGFGVMLDDFAAALCTLMVMALWQF